MAALPVSTAYSVDAVPAVDACLGNLSAWNLFQFLWAEAGVECRLAGYNQGALILETGMSMPFLRCC